MSVIKFKYRQEEGPLGSVLRPVASVVLIAKSRRLETLMYIDSGADITTIPLEAGLALGFQQNPKGRLLEMRGVSGGSVPYLIKTVSLVLNGTKMQSRIAWALIEEVPFLLGRLDVFNRFDITFQERQGAVFFRLPRGNSYPD